MVHGKPLTSTLILDGSLGFCKAIHHGIGRGVCGIVSDFGTASGQGRNIARSWQCAAGDGWPPLGIGHVVHGILLVSGQNVPLLGWELVRREATVERLLRVGAGRKVLLLLNPLSHALHHIGWELAHLIHVGFLLHALGLSRNGVKGALLRGEVRNALIGSGSETSGNGIVLSGAAFGAEHAVCWNLFAACAAVHGATPF